MAFRLLGFLSGAAFLLSPLSSAAGETPRASVLSAMAQRPKDPWPRGQGHVVLAVPGSPEDFKAYHEPGGSFSPAFASFGVSLWVTGEKGGLVATSDSIPLEQLTQRLVWSDKSAWPRGLDLPAIATRTPYYDIEWSALAGGDRQLHLRAKGTNHTWLVVRSVGPAGAPLTSLNWLDGRLFVSDRWVIRFSASPAEVEVVPPPGQESRELKTAEPRWQAEKAWGYARLRLMRNQEYWITIEDTLLPPPNPLPSAPARARIKLKLPDASFVECLNAQVAHLMMGLVNNETRPGDPNNYPLNWLRDGAYIIVALARAGQIEVAKDLSRPFAEYEFFGGFGSEADAPGLALWTLGEVSALANDPKFDAWLWPHVQRKADLIGEMLAAKGPLRKPYLGPIVPAHAGKQDLDLVCDAAQDGLIQGRMDWHRPILYIHAVSYAGLRNAANVANRLGKPEAAEAFLRLAAQVCEGWLKAFNTAEANNDRTFISGLYPAWIVADREAYQTKLAARRAASHDSNDVLKGSPLWTYFNLAEAHQWLALGQPEKVWSDVHWFWKNQASPGLYTWWEGSGEENTFHRWEQARGWVKPPHVTPHYWTAAEMLLLQLDMLAYVDESAGSPTLVVGAGVPAAWLAKAISVENLPTRLGKVDWSWDRGRLTVKVKGAKCGVKLGPAFPADTKLRIRD
jgi:hypothetical protein